MFNPLSNFFKWIKMSVAGIGGVTGTYILINGIITGGATLIAGGVIYILLSSFAMFDSTKILQDIKKQIDILEDNIEHFKDENDRLSRNVTELEETKNGFMRENKKLSDMLKKGKQQLDELEKTKNDYIEQNELLKSQIGNLGGENAKFIEENENLKISLDKLNELKENISLQNQQLQITLKESQKQLAELEKAKEEYIQENKKYQGLIKESEQQLSEFKDENAELKSIIDEQEAQLNELKEQIEKLKGLYRDTKELLAKLMTAGDMFSSFSESIGSNVDRLGETNEDLDQTSQVIKNLVDVLKDQEFDKLDLDGDGVITAEEFNKVLGGKK